MIPLARSKILLVTEAAAIDWFLKYLRERAQTLVFVALHHPRNYMGGPPVKCFKYSCGQEVARQSYGKTLGKILTVITRIHRSLLQPIMLYLALIAAASSKTRFDVALAYNVPCPLPVALLKKLGLVRRDIFISGDHVTRPRSLSMKYIFDITYRLLDKYLQNNVDAVWYLSKSTLLQKEKEGWIRKRKVIREIVPIPCNPEIAKSKRFDAVEHQWIGYLGKVDENSGLELVLDAIYGLINLFSSVRLKVIGTGPSKDLLLQKARFLGIENNLQLLGYVEDKDYAFDLMKRCAFCVAPYKPCADQGVNFTDSAKIKEYLSCGSPVVVTRIRNLEIASEIEREHAGFAVGYNVEEMRCAMMKLLGDQLLWRQCVINAVRLADKYNYETVYGQAFRHFGMLV